MIRPDIANRSDIILLVDTFYDKVKRSDTLAYIFNEIANVSWESHMPKMYSFWGSVLLGEPGYSGNPMEKHIALNKLSPLSSKEFSEWLFLFTQTVDELFEGNIANHAKQAASNIARLMLSKMES